jgi:predicted dehydrogenase
MKALVIGYGSIGKRHTSILDGLGLELMVISRQDHLPFQSFKKLTDAPLEPIDYFVIANDTFKHYETLQQLNSIVKDKTILVEKPLFDSSKKIDGINNSVFVAYNLRFHPILLKIRQLIGDERILYMQASVGQYLPDWRPDRDYRDTYSANKEKGGGVLLDLSHEIDYLQWIGGSFTNITAFQEKLTDLEIDSDDFVTGIAKTPTGGVVNFSMDYCSKKPFRQIVLHTNQQTIQADLISGTLNCVWIDGKPEHFTFEVERNQTYREMHQSILKEDALNVCTYNEGICTMDVLDRIKNG